MPRTSFKVALLLGAALSQLAFAADSPLSVSDPYVRQVPPGTPTSAAFMIIGNAGNVERKLVKAESAAARVVELHSHVNEDGVMKMRQVPSIDIKARGRAELKPGSYHLMLIDMKQTLMPGDAIPITLGFDDGSVIKIEAPVRKMQTAPADKPMDHSAMTH